MKKLLTFFSVLALSLVLNGCATQKASIEADNYARKLVVPEGKALVYIVRPNTLGFAIKFRVYCDGKYIGTTGGRNYIYTILDAGKHKFISQAENNEEMEIYLEANRTYYIEQVPMMGLIKARNELVNISENEGQEKLLKCKLSADCTENK